MNGIRMRALQAKGYAIAARKTGLQHDIFRPVGATNPLDVAHKIASLPATWKPASPGDAFRGANLYGKPAWFGYYDFLQTRVGDYMVRQEDNATWFIIAQQHLLQPTAVECNAVVSFVRPTSAASFGAQTTYNGDQLATEVPLLTGWPASMLAGSKGEKTDIVIPGDTRLPWFSVLLPAVGGVDLLTNDIMLDGAGRRYKVSSVEKTDLGFRLSVAYSQT